MALKDYLKKISESYEISKAKEFTQLWKDSGMQDNMEEWFGDKDRIYFPLYEDPDKQEILDYFDGSDFYVISFEDGIAGKYNDDRKYKLGKVLKRLGGNNLLDKFSNYREKSKNKKEVTGEDLYIVISRHPYDIGGMSQGREWQDTSCMRFNGIHANYINCDIKNGALIAYLIKSDDRNIEKPLARMRLIPLVNVDDANDVIYTTGTIFGIRIQEFKSVLEDWLIKKTEGKVKDKIYKLNYDTDTTGAARSKDFRNLANMFDWEYDGNNIISNEQIDLSNKGIDSLKNIRFE